MVLLFRFASFLSGISRLADQLYIQLMATSQSLFSSLLEEKADQIRKRLKRVLGFVDLTDYEIILTPSGTDGEAILLLLALGEGPEAIRNIFMAPLELGHGSVLAGSGKFFDTLLPNGKKVQRDIRFWVKTRNESVTSKSMLGMKGG